MTSSVALCTAPSLRPLPRVPSMLCGRCQVSFRALEEASHQPSCHLTGRKETFKTLQRWIYLRWMVSSRSVQPWSSGPTVQQGCSTLVLRAHCPAGVFNPGPQGPLSCVHAPTELVQTHGGYQASTELVQTHGGYQASTELDNVIMNNH